MLSEADYGGQLKETILRPGRNDSRQALDAAKESNEHRMGQKHAISALSRTPAVSLPQAQAPPHNTLHRNTNMAFAVEAGLSLYLSRSSTRLRLSCRIQTAGKRKGGYEVRGTSGDSYFYSSEVDGEARKWETASPTCTP
jgi:hypothetical protein